MAEATLIQFTRLDCLFLSLKVLILVSILEKLNYFSPAQESRKNFFFDTESSESERLAVFNLNPRLLVSRVNYSKSSPYKVHHSFSYSHKRSMK